MLHLSVRCIAGSFCAGFALIFSADVGGYTGSRYEMYEAPLRNTIPVEPFFHQANNRRTLEHKRNVEIQLVAANFEGGAGGSNFPEQQSENHDHQRRLERQSSIDAAQGAAAPQTLVGTVTKSAAEKTSSSRTTHKSTIQDSEDVFVSMLIQEGAYRQALPYLKTRAAHRGGNWLYLYADAAKQSGETEQLARFLSEELARTDLSRQGLEQRVWALTDALPNEAVNILRQKTEQRTFPWVEYYAQALKKIGGDSSHLMGLIHAELLAPNTKDDERQILLFLLSEIAGEKAIIAQLHDLSLSGNDKWFNEYTYRLTKAGLGEQLANALFKRGLDSNVSMKRRRDAGYALLDLGKKNAAVQVFQALAGTAPPKSQDVQELMFLWGPRPQEEAVKWLAQRALTAMTFQARAAWLKSMVEKGAALVALRLIETHSWGQHPAMLHVKVKAYYELGENHFLRKSLIDAISVTHDEKPLIEYAELAQEKNFAGVSQMAWEAILATNPKAIRPLKELGILAFERDAISEAEIFLGQYRKKMNTDFQATYYVAECLRARKDIGAANEQYRLALRQLQRAKPKKSSSDVMELVILSHLGKLDLARQKFETLSKSIPVHRKEAIVNAYAEALISSGWNKEALSVLSTQ